MRPLDHQFSQDSDTWNLLPHGDHISMECDISAWRLYKQHFAEFRRGFLSSPIVCDSVLISIRLVLRELLTKPLIGH